MEESYDEFIRQLQEFSWRHYQSHTWIDKDDWQWLGGIIEEVGELSEALDGKHEHSPEYELMQIAAIAINFLRHRRDKHAGTA